MTAPRGKAGFWVVGLLFLATAVTASADEKKAAIVPREWKPDLTEAAGTLEGNLEKEMAQQMMNRLSRQLADLKDAELFIIYVRLYQHLEPEKQQALRREQEAWLKKRAKEAEAAIESRGGSLAPLEENQAEAALTEKRSAALRERLKKFEPEKEP